MSEVRVSDLEGAELDYWAAVANGAANAFIGDDGECYLLRGIQTVEHWAPSSDWSQGGPILERERMEVRPCGGSNPKDGSDWQAQHWEPYAAANAGTPLVAAMRAFVASKFGDTVPAARTQEPKA